MDFFCWIFWILKKKKKDFFWFLWILFNVTKVTTKSYQGNTTGHQKWPKMGQNSIISQSAKKASAEGQRPLQELEVGPRSGPYLLVI